MRIQILELPLRTYGEVTWSPFAVVIDEAPDHLHSLDFRTFQEATGADAVLVTAETVEVV